MLGKTVTIESVHLKTQNPPCYLIALFSNGNNVQLHCLQCSEHCLPHMSTNKYMKWKTGLIYIHIYTQYTLQKMS